jgi:hypothetical protein
LFASLCSDTLALVISAVSCLAALATLVVLWLTLLRVRDYVEETAKIAATAVDELAVTKKIAAAGFEQAEAAQKPCLVLRDEYRDPVGAIVDPPATTEVSRRQVGVSFWNIGAGPAMNVRIGVEKKKGEVWSPGLEFHVPFIRPDSEFRYEGTTPLELGERKLTAIYESLSGKSYVTRVALDGQVIRRSEQRLATSDDRLPVSRRSPRDVAERLTTEEPSL